MLNASLNANEVKNSAGTEIEFSHIEYGKGRSRLFAQIAETPNLQHRINLGHTEIGKAEDMRRRSTIGVSKEIIGVSGKKRKCYYYIVGDIPVGDMSSMTEPTNVLAELGSLVFLKGGTTTFNFDGTGTGATVLLNGEL